jgi:hypothetical protein
VNLRGGDDPTLDTGVVILSGECRPLRRSLRPVVWQVLEEVALDAVVEDGRLVARTSARQVAEGLGIDPGSAAAALRALRQRGLVSPWREKGPAGRFGLSVYQLHPVAGLSVVRPCTAEPFTVSPATGQSCKEEPAVGSPLRVAPCMASSGMKERAPRRPGGQGAGASTGPVWVASDLDSTEAIRGEDSPSSPDHSTDSPGSSRHCSGQTALDLGSGSW